MLNCKLMNSKNISLLPRELFAQFPMSVDI
jgi:hypothetical protein